MNKIFRACGGKSYQDVEKIVKEKRELQVEIKIYKAEKDGAVDDLRAYKGKILIYQKRRKCMYCNRIQIDILEHCFKSWKNFN
jgi:hypothetical protein